MGTNIGRSKIKRECEGNHNRNGNKSIQNECEVER